MQHTVLGRTEIRNARQRAIAKANR
jgi:hypothetical protein